MPEPRIVLENAHGRFEVDPQVLEVALNEYGTSDVVYVRRQAAAHAGYEVGWLGLSTALNDCSRIEALIIWIESGNHTFANANPTESGA